MKSAYLMSIMFLCGCTGDKATFDHTARIYLPARYTAFKAHQAKASRAFSVVLLPRTLL